MYFYSTCTELGCLVGLRRGQKQTRCHHQHKNKPQCNVHCENLYVQCDGCGPNMDPWGTPSSTIWGLDLKPSETVKTTSDIDHLSTASKVLMIMFDGIRCWSLKHDGLRMTIPNFYLLIWRDKSELINRWELRKRTYKIFVLWSLFCINVNL